MIRLDRIATLLVLVSAVTAIGQQRNEDTPTAQAGVALDAASAVPDIDAAFSGGIDRSRPTIGRASDEITGFGAVEQGGVQSRGYGGGFGGGGLGGGFGLGGFGLGGFGMGGFGNTGLGTQTQVPTIRTRLVSRIQVARPNVATRVAGIRTNLARLPVASRFSQIEIELIDRNVTLTGRVESDQDRDLLERLISLEPGVSTVENNVEVIALEELPATSAVDR